MAIAYFNYCRVLSFRVSVRFSSSMSNKKGLVLGIYDNEFDKKIRLTPTAELFNRRLQGRLLDLIHLSGPIKLGKSRIFWDLDEFGAVAVAGLGAASPCEPLEQLDVRRENARIAAGAGCQALASDGITEICVESMECPDAASEGGVLSTYKFQRNKSKSKCKPIPSVSAYGILEKDLPLWQAGEIAAACQNWARTLMETPANQMTPTTFAAEAKENLVPLGVTVEARDQKWAESMKMGSFLSVARGSVEPPVFLEIAYNGGPKDKAPVVLVGKGVTFDTGGISLKPTAAMDEMRGDMGGAACVVSTIKALAQLKTPINVVGLIPLTENMPGGKATKPGDVVVAMNGKSICVDNTDAEGRLILADALCYSAKFNPKWVLDIATLTGAMRVALGDCATGVFCSDDKLWDELHNAGQVTGDRMWRFPLFKHYANRVTEYSSYDVNNMGKGKGGGSCVAAAFLSQFRPEGSPWLHLDIAGVMTECTDQSYLPKGMSGRPTRTLVQFIQCQTQH